MDMCYNEIEPCAQIKDTVLGLVVDTIERACVIASKEKDNIHFDIL